MTNAREIRRALIVCGKIGSGKSRLAQLVSESTGWPVVAFGALVRQRATQSGLPLTRHVLQELGQRLYADLGAEGIVTAAIEAATPPNASCIVVDGVRDPPVLEAIRRAASETVAVYLDADEATRYARYASRYPSGDRPTLTEFRAVDRHPIELGVEPLAPRADAVMDGTMADGAVLVQLLDLVRRRGWISAEMPGP